MAFPNFFELKKEQTHSQHNKKSYQNTQITATKENPFNSTLETPWAASKMPFQSEKPEQKTKTH